MAKFNVSNVVVANANDIADALDQLPQTRKMLCIDSRLLNPLQRICGGKMLQASSFASAVCLSNVPQADGRFGVRQTERLGVVHNCLVYICQNDAATLRRIAKHIRHFSHERGLDAPPRIWAHVWQVPCADTLSDMVWESEGVYGLVESRSCELSLMSIDNDAWSLGLGRSCYQTHLQGDWSVVGYLHQALLRLHFVYGPLPQLAALGPLSAAILKLYESSVSLSAVPMHRRAPPEGSFDQVVLLDRTCDMITPLCTQLSYPGLLAETCGVHAGIVSSRTLDPEGPLSKVTLHSHEDEFYKELRDRNYGAAAPACKSHIARYARDSDTSQLDANNLEAMKKITSELRGIKQAGRFGARWRDLRDKWPTVLPENEDEEQLLFGGAQPMIPRIVSDILEEKLTAEHEKMLADGTINLMRWSPPSDGPPPRTKRILVVIVGGITYPELTLLRRVGQKLGREMIMLSDQLLTGNHLVEPLLTHA
ncbi:uncharacterized protein MONBRDRAFT_37824 [Monosiga brevicollis MX1]|uniref:Uncharacterized protein n=1 Tax=Monosiga brevicollis TaxID=81824 RepID=A9V435_MONBE|nr:uncharacterized protein MONBRDRAFT_37824 [Monosiga brevicollis MX1]EDQ87550.1 predicted protein [Monosiga brevicollis MX1]|eukprot:XP_001747470.1 hypothetical protein [Monosiga brevicollis MX1]